ncbi:hypothetical protein FA15DRAFT_675711, partial [Coprinopsis marcescibilis]
MRDVSIRAPRSSIASTGSTTILRLSRVNDLLLDTCLWKTTSQLPVHSPLFQHRQCARILLVLSVTLVVSSSDGGKGVGVVCSFLPVFVML